MPWRVRAAKGHPGAGRGAVLRPRRARLEAVLWARDARRGELRGPLRRLPPAENHGPGRASSISALHVPMCLSGAECCSPRALCPACCAASLRSWRRAVQSLAGFVTSSPCTFADGDNDAQGQATGVHAPPGQQPAQSAAGGQHLPVIFGYRDVSPEGWQ